MRPKNILIAIVAGIALAAGGAVAYRMSAPAVMPTTATVLPVPMPLPEFSLLDQYGAAFGHERFRGQWSLVFFGFTHCPDICPLTLQVLATAKRKLIDRRHAPLPRIVLVSVDPERDTPEVIGQYVENFGTDILGVTGDSIELRRLTDGLGIFFARTPTDGGGYSVDHSTVVLLINPDGDFRAVFGSPHDAGNFVRDLPLIQARR